MDLSVGRDEFERQTGIIVGVRGGTCMYLKHIMLENSGPIRLVDFDLAFTAGELPKPIVLVGANGSGKTNVLSLVADALFEAAAPHYDEVLPQIGMYRRAWFRLVGGSTTTLGAPGEFSLLRFEHEGESLIYKEKSGNVDPNEARQRVPIELQSYINWPAGTSFKEFGVTDAQSQKIFSEEIHAYFPSNRSEIPYWLNRESNVAPEFEMFQNINKKLRKPIYVERSIYQFKQWLSSVMLDYRIEFVVTDEPMRQMQALGNIDDHLHSLRVLQFCNTLLQKVLDNDTVRFAWLGRKSPDKISVASGDKIILPSLDAISGGQSSLLGLFGTLLRYADQSKLGSALDLSAIRGICIVDEIDAHIHVDLQTKVLPNLMRLFPGVQFILSSHSPLFVLGMDKIFGSDGFQLIEMPGANIVSAETYSEFGRALEAVSATRTFNERLLSETSKAGKPIVFVEGETDPPYLCRAAELLGRGELLAQCEI